MLLKTYKVTAVRNFSTLFEVEMTISTTGAKEVVLEAFRRKAIKVAELEISKSGSAWNARVGADWLFATVVEKFSPPTYLDGEIVEWATVPA